MSSPRIATYSIVACDAQNGDLGIAVQSKFLAVGSVVPWARANVGAIATQALANISYGPTGLALLEQAIPANEALEQLLAADDERDHRQVGIVDAQGRVAAHTGRACFPWSGHITGDGYCCQGNFLAGEAVLARMSEHFVQSAGQAELAERMVSALEAAQSAGGDRRGKQSAALFVVREGGSYGGHLDRYIDLRVDDHPEPVAELRRILQLHRFYLTRPGPDDWLPIDKTLAGELQDALRDLGYYQGPNTNTYDQFTREALFAYGALENLEERLVEDAQIDRQVLDFIRRKRDETKRQFR